MTLNTVTTGNVAKVAAITPFLRFYSDDNPGKRDYNSDKQHFSTSKRMKMAICERTSVRIFCSSLKGKVEFQKKPQPASGTFLPFFVVLCELIELVMLLSPVVSNVFKVYHYISL
jgi:hypothetical protein